jgi:hypothetical protein
MEDEQLRRTTSRTTLEGPRGAKTSPPGLPRPLLPTGCHPLLPPPTNFTPDLCIQDIAESRPNCTMDDPDDAVAQLLSRQHGHEPALGEKEQRIADLLAQEEELRLERALIEAQAGMDTLCHNSPARDQAARHGILNSASLPSP